MATVFFSAMVSIINNLRFLIDVQARAEGIGDEHAAGSLEVFASARPIMCWMSGSLLSLLEFFVDSRLDVAKSVANAGQTF